MYALYGTLSDPRALSDPRTLSDPGTLSDPESVQNCSLSNPAYVGLFLLNNADSECGASKPKTGL